MLPPHLSACNPLPPRLGYLFGGKAQTCHLVCCPPGGVVHPFLPPAAVIAKDSAVARTAARRNVELVDEARVQK